MSVCSFLLRMADKKRRTTIKRQVACLVLFLCMWALRCETVRYSVPEEMESGSFVANVAKDLGLDPKRLSARRARVVSEGSRQHFQLNSNTGDLFIKEKMDREELCGETDPCMVQFEIILQNPLQAYPAEIRVYDINDYSPVFSEKEFILKILETSDPGSRFPLENAQDLDVGNNSLQNYSISNNDYFHIYTRVRSDGRKFAELVLDKPLDREEQPEVSLVLTAVDGGSPPRSGTAQIHVIVLDANDNPPVFSQTIYKSRVLENSPKDYLVVTVSATDLDEGNYGEISYSFSQKSKENSKTFNINPVTGELRLTGQLDFETIETYELDVRATDGGGLFSHSKVLVEVLDVNDNPPEVKVTSLTSPIPEDSSPVTVVALFSVRDRDSGNNGKTVCSIEDDLPFSLKTTFKNSYSLVTEYVLDREKVSEYNITITARDLGTPSLSTEERIAVKISDINDNSPEFSQTSYTMYVRENNGPAVLIGKVNAFDSDSEQNAKVTYSLLPSENSSSLANDLVPRSAKAGYLVTKVVAVDGDSGQNSWLSYHLLKATDPGLFTIASQNGEIRTTRLITDRDTVKQKLIVLVRDSGESPLSSSATLNIALVDGFSDAYMQFTDVAVEEEENDTLTMYLIISLCLVSFVFFISVIFIIIKLYRRRNYGEKYMSASGNCCGNSNFQNNLVDVTGNGTLSHSYRYEVCLTTGSGNSEFRFLRPIIPSLPPQHGNAGTDSGKEQDLLTNFDLTTDMKSANQHGIAGTDSGKEQDLLTNLQLNTDLESANEQAQPNPDWRFSQAQRPGTSGSQNGEEGGAWPNNQFDTEMLQAMILASANEAADGNSTLGGGAGTMGLSTRYGPQFTLQHVPDYRQNVYIPGSTATLSNSSGKRDGKSSGSSGGNKKKSGKKEKK
ncbi:protocadherin beta-1-like isoform X9 [Trachemys scripta elegans]|uniref:protocadherin beta-1-like isoform X9 n=1 Tax=Trachemys scripta elegans TaxID=31138 RepID=UPI001553C3B3|nr:protocadherin beta-1-like isoform X9 [Trachemys scripta elegans]